MDQQVWTYRFLVEVWVEPREVPDLPLLVRARVRDLERDEPRYVGSMGEIEEIVEKRLDDAGLAPRRWERDR